MTHLIKLYNPKNELLGTFMALDGSNLYKLLVKEGYKIQSPCGGNGTCGKCKVKVDGKHVLSCQFTIIKDINVQINNKLAKEVVLTDGIALSHSLKISSGVDKIFLNLSKPNLADQRADCTRIMQELAPYGVRDVLNNAEFFNMISQVIDKGNYAATFVCIDNMLCGIESGDTSQSNFGVAIDIGTTTIAAYLFNLIDGTRIGVASSLNLQSKYGADVITRIGFTLTEPDGMGKMQLEIIQCLNSLLDSLVSSEGISAKNIYKITIAANTTMLHFLLGVACGRIARTPFIANFTQTVKLSALQLGLNISDFGKVHLMPSVSAYIGADIVAGVLACGIQKRNTPALLIDMGTNGEMVLGSKSEIFAASVACGPAFEGACISCGVGGVVGAISKVQFEPEYKFSTIGEGSPIGICGSGLVDLIAGLLMKGIIDDTGRLLPLDEIDAVLEPELANRIIESEKGVGFIFATKAEGAVDDLILTSRDVREVQNAKAAIEAGIRVMVLKAGIDICDIAQVFLAGGFGSYIDVNNACKIGLIPAELDKKCLAVGNSAGAGACSVLLSAGTLRQAGNIQKQVKYIELSGCKEFNDFYIDAMMFPV